MTRRRTRSANCALSEMEHVDSLYICSICKILPLPSASDGAGDLRGGSGDEWRGQPPTHPAPSPIPLGALGSGDGGREVGGENGHPHPRRVDGALLRCRYSGKRAHVLLERSFRTSVF